MKTLLTITSDVFYMTRKFYTGYLNGNIYLLW